MPLITKSVSLAAGITGLLTAMAPASVSGSPVNDEPGVCYGPNRRSEYIAKISNRAIGAYCFQLRGGVEDLAKGLGNKALEQFRAAQQAAQAIPDPTSRSLAIDEARAAEALTVESMGQTRDAIALIGQRSQATPDSLTFARAFMLARQEDYAGAVKELENAKRQMAKFWCDKSENALTAIRARAAGQDAPWPAEANGHHLPSYLTPVQPGGGCEEKTYLSSAPTSRAFHAAFNLGERAPGPKAEEALRDMADHIAAQAKKPGGDKWRWVLVGHADEACPKDRSLECGSYNMNLSRERAETVKAQLDAKLRQAGITAVNLRVDYRGMEQPLYPRGYGVADERNRRVQLVPENIMAAGGPTLQCPWEVSVTRADIAGTVGAGGALSTPTMTLSPGSTTAVGRNASYSIRYAPGHSGMTARYFYAFSEIETTAKADLAAMAGFDSNEVSVLQTRGGQLPQGKVFRPDATARQETIHLYVSDERVEQLEALRRPPLTAQLKAGAAKDNESLGPIRYMARVGGVPVAQADLRFLGATKDWGNHAPKISRTANITIDGDPAPGPIASPPSPQPKPGKAPTVLACTFRLSIQ